MIECGKVDNWQAKYLDIPISTSCSQVFNSSFQSFLIHL